MRFVRLALLVLSVPVLTGANCGHPLEDGPYDFTSTEVIRDDCRVMGGAVGAAGAGSLTVVGDELRMEDFTFARTPSTVILLVGSYQKGIEDFYLDGSAANVTATGNGQECLLDLETAHISASTKQGSNIEFDGTLRVSYQVRNNPACVCELWMRFRAVHR